MGACAIPTDNGYIASCSRRMPLVPGACVVLVGACSHAQAHVADALGACERPHALGASPWAHVVPLLSEIMEFWPQHLPSVKKWHIWLDSQPNSMPFATVSFNARI